MLPTLSISFIMQVGSFLLYGMCPYDIYLVFYSFNNLGPSEAPIKGPLGSPINNPVEVAA